MNKATELMGKFAELIVNPLIYVMFAVAFVVFAWGIAEFIRKSSNSDSNEGKSHILWGLVGMVVMVSAFTIVNILLSSFNIPVPDTLPQQAL